MSTTEAGGGGAAAVFRHWPKELSIRFANPFFCGQGGMGRVWAAYDTTEAREVAVKVLREDVGQYAEARDRFWAEAARMQEVPPHPNVIEIFDYGMIGDWCFLTMPLLSGPHVGAMDLLVSEILDVIQQTAAGLAHLHAHGIVHRDIKPSNLVLDGDLTSNDSSSSVKIVDFGIAKAVDITPITKTTSGTEGYMAPELRDPTQEVTPACDIYSLGCVLHALLTGAVPGTPPRPGRDVPAGLQPLVEWMLRSDPTARPDAVRVRQEVGSYLAQTMHHHPPHEVPEPPTTAVPPQPPPPSAPTTMVVDQTAVAPAPTAVVPQPRPVPEPIGVRKFLQEWFTARGQFGRERVEPSAMFVALAAWVAIALGGGWVLALTVLFLLRLVGVA